MTYNNEPTDELEHEFTAELKDNNDLAPQENFWIIIISVTALIVSMIGASSIFTASKITLPPEINWSKAKEIFSQTISTLLEAYSSKGSEVLFTTLGILISVLAAICIAVTNLYFHQTSEEDPSSRIAWTIRLGDIAEEISSIVLILGISLCLSLVLSLLSNHTLDQSASHYSLSFWDIGSLFLIEIGRQLSFLTPKLTQRGKDLRNYAIQRKNLPQLERQVKKSQKKIGELTSSLVFKKFLNNLPYWLRNIINNLLYSIILVVISLLPVEIFACITDQSVPIVPLLIAFITYLVTTTIYICFSVSYRKSLALNRILKINVTSVNTLADSIVAKVFKCIGLTFKLLLSFMLTVSMFAIQHAVLGPKSSVFASSYIVITLLVVVTSFLIRILFKFTEPNRTDKVKKIGNWIINHTYTHIIITPAQIALQKLSTELNKQIALKNNSVETLKQKIDKESTADNNIATK